MKKVLGITDAQLSNFCRRHHIRKLSVFGSILTDRFNPSSDIDVLVEFEPGIRMGLIKMAGIERELSSMTGKKIDMRTKSDLSRYFRDEVVSESEVQYAEA